MTLGVIASKFRGSGQTCVCANRIYVHSSIYAEFASLLTEKVSKFKIGNPMDSTTTHGPLIHSRAVDKVVKHVEDAVSKGAQILVGGKRPDIPGSFYPPTVLSDVPCGTLIDEEETFGPVAALTKFETEEEVIKLANSTDVGLAGYFYSRDVGRVWRVAEALEVRILPCYHFVATYLTKCQVGMVGANVGVVSFASIPFGGVKESGLGKQINNIV